MKVFYQLVYEYQKELRDLCLLTCSDKFEEKIKTSLNNQKINHLICPLENNKINVFFGKPECIEIIKQFSCEKLNNLTVEEDFILGMMLGYGKNQQYQRFLAKKSKII
ncbi:MAG: DUF2023 family protein [Candidatus Gastranaerophilales bacterium]|nr:DUF2023 family protein [Candidatus Gastranaerophilales bacterium]